MNFFEYTDKELFFRNDGELLSIMAWGNNSLRVQSSLMDNIPDDCVALINPDVDNIADIDINITDERHAYIRNGLITAIHRQAYLFISQVWAMDFFGTMQLSVKFILAKILQSGLLNQLTNWIIG